MKFPEDPSAPELYKRAKEKATHKKSWIEGIISPISLIIATLSLLYSVYSFNLSKEAYLESRKQYIENSKSSEQQFRQIADILHTYQAVGETALLNSQLQLKQTTDLVNQTANLGKPILSIETADWDLSESPGPFSYRSTVNLLIKNKGHRPLQIIKGVAFIVNKITGVTSRQSLLTSPEIVGNNASVIMFPTKATYESFAGAPNFVYLILTYADLFSKNRYEVAYCFGVDHSYEELGSYADGYEVYGSETYGYEADGSSKTSVSLTSELAISDIMAVKYLVFKFNQDSKSKIDF